ncbi:hypothetical protein ACWDBO_36880, partial [Streptomyces mirabilis]|uniref:hypothetical protein n=1 Tax=Streptomyces mirabilis TaxID=68239 RepID=UPI0033263B6C
RLSLRGRSTAEEGRHLGNYVNRAPGNYAVVDTGTACPHQHPTALSPDVELTEPMDGAGTEEAAVREAEEYVQFCWQRLQAHPDRRDG